MSDRQIVISYGMGVDSTALLLRWLLQPGLCPAPPDTWLVVTAMTGDEWPQTVDQVTEFTLPLLAANGVRFAQVARGGPSDSDGIAVLDDSRSPALLRSRGPWALSDEMRAAGTVPQVTGYRKCSLRFKGWVIDKFLRREITGPYRHVLGFEAGESPRAGRDAGHDTADRAGWYPLIEWGWDRRACERYIEAQLGVTWQKSACTYCPFALVNKDGLRRTLDRYAADPRSAVEALAMEHLAVALNPRQGLAKEARLADLMAGDPRQRHALRLFEQWHAQMTWNLYEVRRARRDPKFGGRWLQAHASGTREAMRAALLDKHRQENRKRPGSWEWSSHDGIERAWIRRRGDGYPNAEHYLGAAPAGAADKEGPGFASAWESALAAPSAPLW